MKYQRVFHILFLFLLQSAIITYRYFSFDQIRLCWIGLLLESSSPSENSTWVELMKDTIGNWVLILLPVLVYSGLVILLKRFRDDERFLNLIPEVAFQMAILFILHPIQLQALFSSLVKLTVVFPAITFLLFLLSDYFQEFSLLNFSVLTGILTIAGAFTCQQTIEGNFSGYSVGLVTLLGIFLQSFYFEYDMKLQLWCGLIYLGASTVAGLNMLTTSFQTIGDLTLSVIHYGNSKAIDFLFPLLRSNSNPIQLIHSPKSWEIMTQLFSYRALQIIFRQHLGPPEVPLYEFNPWRDLWNDVPQHFSFYLSITILISLLTFYLWKVATQLFKYERSFDITLRWVDYYVLYLITNIPNVIFLQQLQEQEQTVPPGFHYFDNSTAFLLTVLAFAFLDYAYNNLSRGSTNHETITATKTWMKTVAWTYPLNHRLFYIGLTSSALFFFLQHATPLTS